MCSGCGDHADTFGGLGRAACVKAAGPSLGHIHHIIMAWLQEFSQGVFVRPSVLTLSVGRMLCGRNTLHYTVSPCPQNLE